MLTSLTLSVCCKMLKISLKRSIFFQFLTNFVVVTKWSRAMMPNPFKRTLWQKTQRCWSEEFVCFLRTNSVEILLFSCFLTFYRSGGIWQANTLHRRAAFVWTQTTEKEPRLGGLQNFYVFVLLFLLYENWNITNNPGRTSFGKVSPSYCSYFLLLSETKSSQTTEQEPRFRGSNPPELPHQYE